MAKNRHALRGVTQYDKQSGSFAPYEQEAGLRGMSIKRPQKGTMEINDADLIRFLVGEQQSRDQSIEEAIGYQEPFPQEQAPVQEMPPSQEPQGGGFDLMSLLGAIASPEAAVVNAFMGNGTLYDTPMKPGAASAMDRMADMSVSPGGAVGFRPSTDLQKMYYNTQKQATQNAHEFFNVMDKRYNPEILQWLPEWEREARMGEEDYRAYTFAKMTMTMPNMNFNLSFPTQVGQNQVGTTTYQAEPVNTIGDYNDYIKEENLMKRHEDKTKYGYWNKGEEFDIKRGNLEARERGITLQELGNQYYVGKNNLEKQLAFAQAEYDRLRNLDIVHEEGEMSADTKKAKKEVDGLLKKLEEHDKYYTGGLVNDLRSYDIRPPAKAGGARPDIIAPPGFGSGR